jgi:tripartite-type tricarboxylate transporter receptor subunit TctC
MRAIAALDTRRGASLPEVPTSAEAGMPQFVAVNWYLLLGPAGIPREIVQRLGTESATIMQSPETRERFAAIGGEPVTDSPEQTAELLRAEYARWDAVIRDAGIRAE